MLWEQLITCFFRVSSVKVVLCKLQRFVVDHTHEIFGRRILIAKEQLGLLCKEKYC